MKVHLNIPFRILFGMLLALSAPLSGHGQGGDAALQAEADALFEKGAYAKAYPMYSQLVSLSPHDHELNYKFGACTLYGGDEKVKAIGYLKFAVGGPATPKLAWYFLGRAYQLDYQFDEAITAFQHYRGTADKKLLAQFPVDALEQQCRNGKHLLSDLKDIDVMSKVEVEGSDFFRFYDLSDIGGKIVVTPQELLSNMDKKSGERFLTYLPSSGGPIYFSSYGKDGKTGRDIFRSELLPTGGYAAPVKLAGYINTDQDEDYAVMAPDGKTFYFCSQGHNSMGGYDVFRSTYDKGMDVFSAPENMDFAVNTPANEMLYIVGPDGKQAGFASDRDSKQGMVNVYRVGTTQTPLNITVLKGTYASAFDPSDRHARIIVEDDLTRERVADITTDINGEYVLALPRGGKYKVLVEGGPTGRTHLTTVDVPSTHKPQAFRQEIQLVDQGGEKASIRNYFDEPLDEDVMALALDEIRRRAKLDVTAEKATAIAADKVPVSQDPIQAAGFDGTMTMSKATQLAREDADAISALADELEHQSNTAFDLALENLSEAEAGSALALGFVKQANEATAPEEKDRLMRAAAETKERSVEAGHRARAAYRSGMELGEAGALNRKRAATAAALSHKLEQAQAANNPTSTTDALKQLKASMDARKGPEADIGELERARRVATDAASEASMRMRQATAQREDETMLADRIARMNRDVATAKGRKRDDLNAQLAVLEDQRRALHEEVEEAFDKAREAEEAAALVRGQVELLKYLNTAPDVGKAVQVDEGALADVEQRLLQVREGNKALVIEQQYDPYASVSAEERERRTFNWGTGEAIAGLTERRTSTTTQAQRGSSQAEKGSGTNNDQRAASGSSSEEGVNTASNENAAADMATSRSDREGTDPAAASRSVVSSDQANAFGAQGDSTVAQDGMVAVENGNRPTSNGGITPQEGQDQRVDGGLNTTDIAAAQAIDSAKTNGKGGASQDRQVPVSVGQEPLGDGSADGKGSTERNDRPDAGGAAEQGSSTAGVVPQQQTATTDQQPPATAQGVTSQGQEEGLNADEQAFLMANKLAELQQLRQGEKSRAKRDSLDQAITEQRSRMDALQSASAVAEEVDAERISGPPHRFTLLEFDMTMLDEEWVDEAYPGFDLRRKAIEEGPGSAREKASMLHALEMQLVDSIDLQTARILDHLEEHPEQADELLPGLERWRSLKTAHVNSAAEALAQVDQEYAATETRALEDAQLAGQAAPQTPAGGELVSATPHNDSYVSISDDLDRIYASPLVPRSTKDLDAVAKKDRDLQIGEEMLAEIDSMQLILSDTPPGKNYDKLRQKVDRKIDDLLIHNVDLGQRLAFISKSEYAVAKDSAKVLSNSLSRRGLPPDEPLMQMARSYVDAAEASMSKAKKFRKQADDASDIFKRNSLYRQAYAEELKALRDYDRSHTVRNYLLNGQAKAGEALTYEAVEQRVFPSALANASRRALESSSADGVSSGSSSSQAKVDTVRESTSELAVVESRPAHGDSALTAGELRAEQATLDTLNQPVQPSDRGTAIAMEPAPEASLAGSANAAADSVVLSRYLNEYYYLDTLERNMVMKGEEERKYFMIKGRSMEDRAEAEAARNEAEGALELAEALIREAGSLRSGAEAATSTDTTEQVHKLEIRAQALMERSDSLNDAANRLLAAATMNDAQAATLMQGMPADRSAAIMDLEQAKRRTEPLLARTRPRQTAPLTTTTRADQQAREASQRDSLEIAQTMEPREGGEELSPPDTQPVVSTEATTLEPPGSGTTETAIPAEDATSPAERGEGPERITGVAPIVSHAPVPFNTPLKRDVFAFEETSTPRREEIPIDAPMPTGVVYKVQVGAFRNALPSEAFSDMTPVTGEHADNGLVRYTAGMFTSARSASEAGAKVRDRGYRDAFVVAYMDGKRVPLRDAMQAERAALALALALAQATPTSTRETIPPATDAGRTSVVPDPVPAATTTPVPVVIPVQPSEPSPEAAVLADYPTTAEEVLAAFKPTETDTEYYNDPDAAPAKQVEAVKGLFFTVQVGVYSKPTALDRLFNITPLNSERTATGKIRYTTGIFLDEGQAVQRKNGTVTLGVTDAFVTAYLNGKRIPVRDARALLAKFGKDVLVDPALATP